MALIRPMDIVAKKPEQLLLPTDGSLPKPEMSKNTQFGIFVRPALLNRSSLVIFNALFGNWAWGVITKTKGAGEQQSLCGSLKETPQKQCVGSPSRFTILKGGTNATGS